MNKKISNDLMTIILCDKGKKEKDSGKKGFMSKQDLDNKAALEEDVLTVG